MPPPRPIHSTNTSMFYEMILLVDVRENNGTAFVPV